jgi:superfamily II DNA/RNA helicase
MSTKFFTNEGENTLLNKFAGVFEANQDITRFDALVGYLRASGYFSIRPHLERVPKVRILVGINVDEIVEAYCRRGQLFLADSGAAIDKFKKALADDIQEAGYSRKVEDGILTFVDDVVSGKLEIKAHPTKNLHAKIYISLPEGFSEHKPGAVITGSSNLTDAGLGARDRAANYEFNVLLHDFSDVKFASVEFDRLWEEGVAVLPKDIREIKEKSYLREDITPFQLYIKLLIEYFGPAIEFDPNNETDLPQGFLRLSYQMDAVSQGFHLLKKHRGFFLSDVVGLGKTVIATLVAKKFFYHNDFPNHISSTLIILPPALRENWESYVSKFELKSVDIVTCGSLHTVRDPGTYDLVIIDEAHKFRTSTSQGYEALQRICKTPTRRRLRDGSFAEKRVILVSATPLNNKPEDIYSQLCLFQDGKDSTLEVANLQRFFNRLEKEFQRAMGLPNRRDALEAIKLVYDEIRDRVVSEITIRRTRTDLKESAAYKEDLDRQGIRFPDVEPPRKILYKLDTPTAALYDDTLQALASGLTYNRYRAIDHLVPALRLRYPNASLVANQLARIMKTMLVKRLDSSFQAFKKSLCRFRDATDAMVRMFTDGRIFIAPEENVTEYILEGREEELLDRLTNLAATDPSILICSASDFSSGFEDGLRADFSVLKDLAARWEKVTNDPKVDEFLRRLSDELLKPGINPSGKLVIFSEAKDTTDYLKQALMAAGYDRLVCIDASNRRHLMPVVKANFDANSPKTEKADDIDLLISTEVLAEGVNLHRANIVVNYDTPWNSTRLMQRIGRVNRIGTTAERIYIYNFFPTDHVDSQISLQNRAVLKLQAFHSALGEDSQIYSLEEETDNFGLFDKVPEEERDEKLEFLDELRRFRRDNAADFKLIRNLPLRARVGRKDADRTGSTISFVRNVRRDAFYRIRAAHGTGAGESEIEELSFIEAARIFRATQKEKPHALPEDHHAHVCVAVEAFRTALASEAVQGLSTAHHQPGPNERRALQLLGALTNLPPQYADLASPEEKELLRAATEAIRTARFIPMQRRLVTLANLHRKMAMPVADLLDQALTILRQFPLVTESEGGRERVIAGLGYSDLVPSIILSESFTD